MVEQAPRESDRRSIIKDLPSVISSVERILTLKGSEKYEALAVLKAWINEGVSELKDLSGRVEWKGENATSQYDERTTLYFDRTSESKQFCGVRISQDNSGAIVDINPYKDEIFSGFRVNDFVEVVKDGKACRHNRSVEINDRFRIKYGVKIRYKQVID